MGNAESREGGNEAGAETNAEGARLPEATALPSSTAPLRDGKSSANANANAARSLRARTQSRAFSLSLGGMSTASGVATPRPARGNSVRRLFGRSEKFKRRLLLVGLESSGKTSVLNRVGRGVFVPTTPTEGFGAETVWFGELELTLWDVGGQARAREMWPNFFEGVQGLVFVVDSADDSERLEQAAVVLRSCLAHPLLEDVAVLVLANKQDVKDSMAAGEVELAMGLAEGGATRALLKSRPACVMPTSAAKDDGINEALAWLCQQMKDL